MHLLDYNFLDDKDSKFPMIIQIYDKKMKVKEKG